MNKMGKRFVALVVVFASIMSFLPIQFGLNGQAANASTTDIIVSGTTDSSDDSIVNSANGVYSTKDVYKDFTLAVKYETVTQDKIKIGQTGIVDQEVIIKSIDGIQLTGTTIAENNKILSDTIGCQMIEDINSTSKTIGITITGLPYGANTIEYQVKETTVYNKGTDVVNGVATKDLYETPVPTTYPSTATNSKLVIQHANEYVAEYLKNMSFDAYTGGSIATYETNKDLKDSKIPFLFTTKNVTQDNVCPLKYTFDVTNSIKTLKYTMTFESAAIDEAYIYKNGTLDEENEINGSAISGYLTNLGSSDLIVARIRDTGKNVLSTYAIQLNYTTVVAEDDCTLRDGGITKFKFNSDSDYEAYIDKALTVTKEGDIPVYSGTIHIDEMADLISLEPILGKSVSNVAFEIENHYDIGNNGDTEESSLLDNGTGEKQYVNFHKGSVSNEIWLKVYEGKDGSISGNLLAIYKFSVDIIKTHGSSTVDFDFDSDTILTQPGRDKTEKLDDFNVDRRSYDLYSDTNNVTVTLNNPVTYGELGERREYIKAWGGTSAESDSVTEITGLDQSNIVQIDVSSYEKLVLQAYYEDTVYVKDKDGKPIQDANGEYKIQSQKQYPIGQKYTFYIANNITSGTNPDTTSSDASLSNIKASNGIVKSTDGTSGFSSSNYTVKVPKIDTLSGITITATNSYVKDITATIIETGDEYGLTSGESFDFPLNSTGITNIKVLVTAKNGITSKTYNIIVTNDTRSASALLKNVVTDNGDFTFDPEADLNKIRVDQAINKLKVSPIAEDYKSKITVNGDKFSGTPITIDIKGSQETDMEIKVTSEDGSDSKTYSFQIYRTDAALDNTDGDTTENDIFYDDIDDCLVDTSKYEEWGVVKGKDVYFNNKGRQVKNQWINTKNIWYFLDSKGYKTSGWRKDVGGKTYYLDQTTGQLKTGWMNQNSKWYYLGKNGVMQKGWLSLNGRWYYFTPEGEMIINQSMFIDDKVYNFAQDGSIY